MVAVRKLRNTRSLQKGKSMRSAVLLDGKVYVVDHGAAGATIKPGTKKGDSYCARSAEIKMTPTNIAARAAWNCKGKKSMKTRPKMYDGKISRDKINMALRRKGALPRKNRKGRK